MNKREYQDYVQGLEATEVLTGMINKELKLNGINRHISNCWLDSKGKYARFVFQIDNLANEESVTEVLANKYEREPMSSYKGMVDAKQIGADINKFLENYGVISRENKELENQIYEAFGAWNITVYFNGPDDFGEYDEKQLFITPIRYEIICCHYTDGARNGV